MKLCNDETLGSEIECPYCGYEYSDSWEWLPDINDEWRDKDCPACGKLFQAIRIITVDYYARTKPESPPKESENE